MSVIFNFIVLGSDQAKCSGDTSPFIFLKLALWASISLIFIIVPYMFLYYALSLINERGFYRHKLINILFIIFKYFVSLSFIIYLIFFTVLYHLLKMSIKSSYYDGRAIHFFEAYQFILTFLWGCFIFCVHLKLSYLPVN